MNRSHRARAAGAAVTAASLAAFFIACTVDTGRKPDQTETLASALFTAGIAVATQHNDTFRTGSYLNETRINAASLQASGMSRKLTIKLDGLVETQVLYVPEVKQEGVAHNVAFVATTKNAVHAFDVDTGAELWPPVHLTTTQNPGGIYSTPVIDVTASIMYVLYRSQEGQYLVGDGAAPSNPECLNDPSCTFRVAALDIRNGATLNDQPIPTSLPGHPGLSFIAAAQGSRPGLLLTDKGLYVAFGAYNESLDPYRGWLLRIDTSTLSTVAAFTTSPSYAGHSAAGIWQSGGGIAADTDGNIYVATGNGLPDYHYPYHEPGVTDPAPGPGPWFGNSLIKLTPSLDVAATYPSADPSSQDFGDAPGRQALSGDDLDFGSGGVVLLPGAGTSPNVLAGGKTGRLYLTDAQLRLTQHFQAFFNMYEEGLGQPPLPTTYPPYKDKDGGDIYVLDDNPHLHGTPVYWRGPERDFGYVYAWSEKDNLKGFKYSMGSHTFGAAFPPLTSTNAPWAALCPPTNGDFVCNGKIAEKETDCRVSDGGVARKAIMPGGMLSLSANGTAAGSGVLWATLRTLDPSNVCQPRARLLAYDAETLKLLWQDDFGWQDNVPTHDSPKWGVPTIADGKLLVGTGDGYLLVYELPVSKPVAARVTASSNTSPVKVTWAADDPGIDGFHIEVLNGPTSPVLSSGNRSYTFTSLPNGLGSWIRVCSHMRSDIPGCTPWAQPVSTQGNSWFDVTRAELDDTSFGFSDVKDVSWAQGARAAHTFCTKNGFVGGQLSGHEALDAHALLNVVGVTCTGTATSALYETSAADRLAFPFSFDDVNVVGWAAASRNAYRYCNSKGYAGGHYDGNESAPAGTMGIVCYRGSWNDVPKTTPPLPSLSNANLDLTAWAEASAAASDWCSLSGDPLGGQLNGWQSSTTDGMVCYAPQRDRAQGDSWFDITKAELDVTGWGFSDVKTVAWAQGARAAFKYCTNHGFVGGQLNGHEALGNNGALSVVGVVCTGTSTSAFFDSAAAERQALPFPFNDINAVGWAAASRNAHVYCTNKGFQGGQYNGNQSAPAGSMGIVCYSGTWNDVPKSASQLALVSNPNLDLAGWASAAAAANDWCTSAGGFPLGGRFNGWQSATTDGTICYR